MKKLITILTVVLITTSAFAQVPTYVPTTGLVSWWGFTGNANDLSGNGNNGTVNGATLTTDRFLNPNSAYNFSGGNYIEVLNNASLNYSNNISFTISAWIQLSSSQTPYTGIVTKMDNTFSNGYQFVVGDNTTSNVLATEFGQGATGVGFEGNQNLIDASWHNVLYVVNRATNTISFYIDNTLDNQTTNANVSLANIDNTANLEIGVERSMADYFNGKIDDIGMWNRALTQQEINNLFTGTLDTCQVAVYDTTHIAVYDTTHLTAYDTTHITINDTTHYSAYDTTHINVYDTVFVYDTVVVQGINVLNNTNTMKIYPNPTSHNITIDNGNYALMEGYSIKITNTLGQIVYLKAINEQQFNIDLSTWTGHGTYFVYIIDPKNKIIELSKIIYQ